MHNADRLQEILIEMTTLEEEEEMIAQGGS